MTTEGEAVAAVDAEGRAPTRVAEGAAGASTGARTAAALWPLVRVTCGASPSCAAASSSPTT
eukprot:3804675-Prymnesium_polylepis.1